MLHWVSYVSICNRSWSPDFFHQQYDPNFDGAALFQSRCPSKGSFSTIRPAWIFSSYSAFLTSIEQLKHTPTRKFPKSNRSWSESQKKSCSHQTSKKILSFPASCRYPLEPQTKKRYLEPVGVLIWQSVEFFKRHLYIGQYWSIFIFHHFEMLGLLGRLPPALLSVEVTYSRYDSYHAQIYIVSRQTTVGLKKEEPWEWFPKSDISGKDNLQGKATPWICGWILLPWPEKLEAQNSSLDCKSKAA